MRHSLTGVSHSLVELGVAKWAEAYVSEEARVVPIRPGLVPGTSAQHLEWTLC